MNNLNKVSNNNKLVVCIENFISVLRYRFENWKNNSIVNTKNIKN